MDDVLIDAPLEITPDMVTTDCFHYHYLVIQALDPNPRIKFLPPPQSDIIWLRRWVVVSFDKVNSSKTSTFFAPCV